MKFEDQHCSFELSEKLKQLNVKQDSLFYWIKSANPKAKHHLSVKGSFNEIYHEDDMISAFNVAELGEFLPLYEYRIVMSLRFIGFYCPHFEVTFKELSEVNCRAKMLIYLIENKLIEVPK